MMAGTIGSDAVVRCHRARESPKNTTPVASRMANPRSKTEIAASRGREPAAPLIAAVSLDVETGFAAIGVCNSGADGAAISFWCLSAANALGNRITAPQAVQRIRFPAVARSTTNALPNLAH